jgi:hypothetical protein
MNVFQALQDEPVIAKCLRSQLALTPHRASKLKFLILQWAQNGLVLEDGRLVALSPDLALDRVIYAMQHVHGPTIDESARQDILVAISKARGRSLRELGLFKSGAL